MDLPRDQPCSRSIAIYGYAPTKRDAKQAVAAELPRVNAAWETLWGEEAQQL